MVNASLIAHRHPRFRTTQSNVSAHRQYESEKLAGGWDQGDARPTDAGLVVALDETSASRRSNFINNRSKPNCMPNDTKNLEELPKAAFSSAQVTVGLPAFVKIVTLTLVIP